MCALINQDLDMVNYLVNEAHANVSQENNLGFSPLTLASVGGNLEAVKCLAKSEKFDINKQTSTEGSMKGTTALIAASMQGYLAMVKYLVEECNADINIKDRYGKTALDHATYYKRWDVVRYLKTAKGTDLKGISRSRSKSLSTSDKEKVDEFAQKLQQLFQEIREKNIDEVKKQVEENPELINKKDENGFSPLIVGTFEGSLELVKFFIEKKANIEDKDINGNTALIYAAKKGYTKIAEVLLYGLQEKKPKKVENYIMSRNERTETALSLAMINGKQNIMELFLTYLSTKTKEKVILLAIQNDNWDLVEDILNNESDIDIRDIKDDYGNNLLILAAGEGNYELVKKLLNSSGINVNARNTEGYTALMRAVSGEYKNIVEFLLKQQDIKISARNNYDRTVFDLAKSIGNKEILALLEPYQKKDAGRTDSISAIDQKQTYTMEFLKSGLSEMNKSSLSDETEKKIHQILYILSIDPSSVIYESLRNNFGTVKGWQGYQIKAYSAKTSRKGRLSFAIATHLKTKKQKILVIEAIDEHYAFMKNYTSLGDFLNKNKNNFVPYVPKKQV